MDYFSQNEASQLVKTALNANALKLNGIRSNEGDSRTAAQIDGSYMLALYRELLGPEGAAATMGASQQGNEEQEKFQIAMQQVIAAATQQVQANELQAQGGQQPQQLQQAPQAAAGPSNGAAGAPGGQPDFRSFIPEAFRMHVPEDPPAGAQ